MQPPDVRYARSADVAIAYQVVGVGPVDVVFVRRIAGDLLSTWEQPLLVRHVEGLAACGRVLMLDKRGTGLCSGAMPCVPLRRYRRYDRADVEAWLKECKGAQAGCPGRGRGNADGTPPGRWRVPMLSWLPR